MVLWFGFGKKPGDASVCARV